MIALLCSSIAVILLGGAAAFLLSRTPERASRAGCAGVAAGSLLGLVSAFTALAENVTAGATLPCRFPAGAFTIGIDPLSAFFLLPLFLLAPLAAVYATGYLRTHFPQARIGKHWLLLSLFLAGMILVLVARDSILFLAAWEGMTIASYLLIVLDDAKPSVRSAGLLYLVLSHVGVACLTAFFLLLGGEAGETDFSHFLLQGGTGRASALFVLALLGFGLKAGLVPLHVWLPEAHPAAPSHVSALMSGVMIKLGIYGLARTLSLTGSLPLWWGYALAGLGAASALIGVLLALAQSDLKRLLAYSSVENIGIILIGFGAGAIGAATGSATLSTLGFAGGLLHVLNHALFKGLLFLGAGSVQLAAGTREIDWLGGLLKRMRWTGLAFLLGAAALCGLPPLNGFVGEFLIYLGALREGAGQASPAIAAVLFGMVTALALAGALGVACFSKAFGLIFLGEPRSAAATAARESAPSVWAPLLILAGLCLLAGFAAPFGLDLLKGPLDQLHINSVLQTPDLLDEAAFPLARVTGVAVCLLLLTAALALLRAWLLSGRSVRTAGTWDCGYGAPTPRMQYSASSYSQLITGLFSPLLALKLRLRRPRGYFPGLASLAVECRDAIMSRIYQPLGFLFYRATGRLRVLQHGNTHLYVLYIAVTLMAFLCWALGWPA